MFTRKEGCHIKVLFIWQIVENFFIGKSPSRTVINVNYWYNQEYKIFHCTFFYLIRCLYDVIKDVLCKMKNKTKKRLAIKNFINNYQVYQGGQLTNLAPLTHLSFALSLHEIAVLQQFQEVNTHSDDIDTYASKDNL